MSTPSGSTVDDAVSQLVRAAMGSSIPSSLSNDELDRHVAELILQEAKQKEERYEELGLRAYIPAKFPETAAPKTNKRFLSSVIKSTDEHNRTLLRTQALAAADAKARKEEEHRMQRMSRACEAADSRRKRKKGHHSRERSRSSSPRRRHRHKRKGRSWDRDGVSERLGSRRRRRSRSPSSDTHTHSPNEQSEHSRRKDTHQHRSPGVNARESKAEGHRSRRDHLALLEEEDRRSDRIDEQTGNDPEDPEETRKRKQRRSDKSRRSLRHPDSAALPPLPTNAELNAINSTPSSQPDPPTFVSRRDESPLPIKSKFKPIDRPPSPPPPIASGSSLLPKIASRSPSPGPAYSSKMDRYFTESYDPRLDTAPLNKKPRIPKDGLIPSEDFEGWDAMLELIQLRRKDKAEKKQIGVLQSKESKKRKKSDRPLELAWEKVEKKRQALNDKEPGVLDIRYQSKGAVREWDMGKVDVDLL